VEEISVMFPDDYRKATLIMPEGTGQTLEIFRSTDGSGVTIEKVSVCATIKVEQ
jgi:hypothetical protein